MNRDAAGIGPYWLCPYTRSGGIFGIYESVEDCHRGMGLAFGPAAKRTEDMNIWKIYIGVDPTKAFAPEIVE